MKRSALQLALSAVGCVLFLAAQSKAGVIGCTSLDFDDGSGVIYGRAWIESDYGSSWDYDLGVYGYLSSDDGADYFSGSASNFESLTAEVDLQVPARADMGYEMDGTYSVHINYQEENERGGFDWIDEENYSYYLTQYVFNPDAYYFYGPGPAIVVSNRHVDLGETYSRKKVGKPNHLQVVLDRYVSTDCGSVRRLVTLKVVDSAGHGVGRANVMETLENPNNPADQWGSVYNSCRNSNYSPAACSPTDPDNTFTDQLWVGCPSSGGTCGFPDVGSRWWWCPVGKPPVSLSTNLYQVRHNQALINGNSTPYQQGDDWY